MSTGFWAGFRSQEQYRYKTGKKLSDFDLEVGEKVKAKDDSGRWELYRITGVYKFVFTVESLESGVQTSFPKVDALTGDVKRCR